MRIFKMKPLPMKASLCIKPIHTHKNVWNLSHLTPFRLQTNPPITEGEGKEPLQVSNIISTPLYK